MSIRLAQDEALHPRAVVIEVSPGAGADLEDVAPDVLEQLRRQAAPHDSSIPRMKRS